jgi:hypothetical protein
MTTDPSTVDFHTSVVAVAMKSAFLAAEERAQVTNAKQRDERSDSAIRSR